MMPTTGANHFDVIILGQGAMGSAAAWAAAKRGLRVLGLEQFAFGHALGSSHGHSRIIREVYYEHPAYVPLAQEAFQRWEELETLSGKKLLTRCRCANIGSPTSEIIEGVSRAVAEHGLPAERWSAAELRRRVPALVPDDDMVAIVEERAGWLAVEHCVLSMQAAARKLGATLHDNEPVINWKASEQGVTVTTTGGTYHAAQLILSAGPWATLQLPQLPLTVMRQMQLWFTPPPGSEDHFQADRFPIFIMDTPLGGFYGIPFEGGPGVKLAQHYGSPEQDRPEHIQRDLVDADVAPVRQFMKQHLPLLSEAPLTASATCIYTLTPDRHFVVDLHPQHQNVALACGFSGHGFKFAPVIGEMLVEMLATNEPEGVQSNEPEGVSPRSSVRREARELFSIKRMLAQRA
jgi:sarcosine oxidase